jgi:hypothetical protein
MPAATKNLVFEQNSTFKMRLIWMDKNRKPVNLTGYTAKLQVRSAAGGSLLVDATILNGYITLGTVNGVIDIQIPQSIINALTFTTAVYDLIIIDPALVQIRFLQGKVTRSPGVTQ